MKNIFCLLALVILFASCTKTQPISEAASAISTRSAVVVRINSLSSLQEDLQKSAPGIKLKKSILFEDIVVFTNQLGHILPEDVIAGKIFASYQQSGATSYNWLFSFPAKDLVIPTGIKKVAERAYGAAKIITAQLPDTTKFYVAEAHGLWLMSKSASLIEDGLKQLESGTDLLQNAEFVKALKSTNPKDPANLLIQFKQVPAWLQTRLESKTEWPEFLATWAALDVDFNEKNITLSGLSMASDSSNTYLGLFKGAGNGSAKFAEVVPQNAVLVVSQNCANVGNWHKNFEVFLGKQNRLKKRNTQLEEYKIDSKAFLATTSGEFGVFYVDGSQPALDRKVAFIRTKSTTDLQKMLLANGVVSTQTYRDFSISQMQNRNILPLIYGKLFSYISQPYWFVYKEWLVFAPNLEVAQAHINNLLTDKTWQNSANYEAISSTVNTDAHIIVVAKNPEWLQMAATEMKPDFAKKLSSQIDSLAQINWIVAQMELKGDAAYTQISFVEVAKTEAVAKQYWTTKLEAQLVGKPVFVKNHLNGQSEIFVEDAAHNVYLINAKGEILWKRNVGETLLGEVDQIDMYKNNKLQLAFTTPSQFFIVDRNGEDVAPFPLKLKDQATAAALLADYDNNRNYRILIPEGRRLQNYGLDGIKTKGWDFKKAKENIVTQPQHNMANGKDYIFMADADGNVLVVDRKGDTRLKLKNKMSAPVGNLYFENDKSTPKISSLGQSGYVRSITFIDVEDSIQAFSQKPNTHFYTHKLHVFGADGAIYIRGKALNLNIETEEDLAFPPYLSKINGSYFVSATVKNEAVWVFGQDGKPVAGMPVYGNSTAAIGTLAGKDIFIIVGTSDGSLLAYKIDQ